MLPAQSTYSKAVSLNLVHVPAMSDQYVAPSGHRTPIHTGRVKSTQSNGAVIIDDGQYWTGSAWATNQFPNFEGGAYLQMLSGSAAGSKYKVTRNVGSAIHLEEGIRGMAFTDAVSAGDKFCVVPCWTAKRLVQDMPQGTELLRLSTTRGGINNGAISVAEHFTGYGWYTDVTNTNDSAIDSDEVFIVRNNELAPVTYWCWGHVDSTDNYRQNLSADPNAQNDHYITFTGAEPITLGELPTLAEDGDELFFFDLAYASQNKGAVRGAKYYADYGWYDKTTKVDDLEVLEPGCGYVLRKAPKPASASSAVWSDPLNY